MGSLTASGTTVQHLLPSLTVVPDVVDEPVQGHGSGVVKGVHHSLVLGPEGGIRPVQSTVNARLEAV